jgi:tRNA-intron endonuclease
MQLPFDGDRVRGDSAAREQFYDARGYGTPRDGGVELAPVEAAHLLFRSDLEHLLDRRSGGEPLDFESFLASNAVSEVDFFVYKELRDRGFYLSPTELLAGDDADRREHYGDDADRREHYGDADRREHEATGAGDFVVYPRGDGPWDDTVAYRVWTVSERADVTAGTLRRIAACGSEADGASGADGDGITGVLAVVDEESEVTYLAVEEPTIAGSTYHDLPAVAGALLSDRVLVTDPPAALHDRAFYGQPLDRDEQPVQLSLVEAAYLAERGLLAVDGGGKRLVSRGRSVEGDRFDRRLRAYGALRTAGIVPKTGFKFGADFRTYADVDSVDDLGHSELLVRVLPADHTFAPRDLALDVRLAHGVRKQLVFALTRVDAGIDWLTVSRLTP